MGGLSRPSLQKGPKRGRGVSQVQAVGPCSRLRFVGCAEAVSEVGRRDHERRAQLTDFVLLESGSTEHGTRSSVRGESPQG